VIAGLIGAGTLVPLSLMFLSVLPVSMGHMLYALLVGTAIGIFAISFLFLNRAQEFSRFEELRIRFNDACRIDKQRSILFGIVMALLFAMGLASIMHWANTATIPTIREIGAIFGMFILFLPFFLVKEFYFRAVQGRLRQENVFKEYFSMLGIGIFMDNILLIPVMFLTWQNPNQTIGFIALSLTAVVIFSIIQQFLVTWIYMNSSRNILSSAFFLSIFYAWMIVNFFPFGLNTGVFS